MNKVICLLFGHEITLLRNYRWHYKVLCQRCGGLFGVCHEANAFLPWDDELQDLVDD